MAYLRALHNNKITTRQQQQQEQEQQQQKQPNNACAHKRLTIHSRMKFPQEGGGVKKLFRGSFLVPEHNRNLLWKHRTVYFNMAAPTNNKRLVYVGKI